jgi:hypothetical protein
MLSVGVQHAITKGNWFDDSVVFYFHFGSFAGNFYDPTGPTLMFSVTCPMDESAAEPPLTTRGLRIACAGVGLGGVIAGAVVGIVVGYDCRRGGDEAAPPAGDETAQPASDKPEETRPLRCLAITAHVATFG